MNVLEDWKTMNRAKKLNKAAVLAGTGQEKTETTFHDYRKAFLKAQKVNISTMKQIMLNV